MKFKHIIIDIFLILIINYYSYGHNYNQYTNTYKNETTNIEAGFIPENKKVYVNQPIILKFYIENNSCTPLIFQRGGAERGSVRDNNFIIEAVNKYGETLTDPYSYNNFGGISSQVKLNQGDIYVKTLFLNYWCKFDKSGSYTINCQRKLTQTLVIKSTFILKVIPFSKDKAHHINSDYIKRLKEINNYKGTGSDRRWINFYQMQRDYITALSYFSNDQTADVLIETLKSSNNSFDIQIQKSLIKMNKIDYACNKLITELEADSPSQNLVTIKALGYLKNPISYDFMIKLLGSDYATIRHTTAEALGDLGDKRAIEYLKKYVDDEDLSMRIASIKGLHRLGEPLDLESLKAIILQCKQTIRNHGNNRSFYEAIRLIQLYGGIKAAPVLVSCLDFNDPYVDNSYHSFLMQYIEASKNGPKYYYKYHSDPNTKGTLKQIKENQKILDELKKWLNKNKRK